jgi:hypothetical protein
MTDFPHRFPLDVRDLSLDSRLIAVATVLLALVVAVLPHFHW